MRKCFAIAIAAALLAVACGRRPATDVHVYDSHFDKDHLDYIAFPIGGMGAGMFCLEGTGAISHMSVRNRPDLFNEPTIFAAIHVNGLENGTKVIEGPVPERKKFGNPGNGTGSWGRTYGLPRFAEAEYFEARFPFATISLKDGTMPVKAEITGWSPFIPGDEDNSSLPAGALEYSFTNTSSAEIEAVFSFNSRNFMGWNDADESETVKLENGFALKCIPDEKHPWDAGAFAVTAPFESEVMTDCGWFRGGWFDPTTMAWNKVVAGDTTPVEPAEGTTGGSLYVPFKLAPGESKTIQLLFCWYVPLSDIRFGGEPATASDFGDRYDKALYKDYPQTYIPWYASRFGSLDEVNSYWKDNYNDLRNRTSTFTEAFYDSTLPDEVVRAVADNLTILKSTTVLRQHDGRFWAYEGSGDNGGSCSGSCTHVWNYAQALPHLFPRMERTLRETEFNVSQDTYGHQMYRSALPIRPLHHDHIAATDGQLGGVIKAYRDWRISGDTEWLRGLYPQIKASLEYCIRTWDPREVGAMEEPHITTYESEFWGADGMCNSFYVAALEAMVEICKGIGEDPARYEELYAKCRAYMENELWNGEYFYHKVRWTGLDAKDPTRLTGINDQAYSPEALALLEQEGPKYQYGTGCLSDGIIGSWMALCAGLDDPVDSDKVAEHLRSVYRYNLKKDLFTHSNPQRPGYAFGHEGGLLLCSWPHGGKQSLPFVYSDEVWTGIEYQVAANLIFEGEVGMGLDIVRTCLDRYDGSCRNPFNEYECGNWYSRAMSSYSLLQAMTGARYDAVTSTLYIAPRVDGDFRSFISTEHGFGTVGIRNGEPFLEVRQGTIPVENIVRL